MASGPSETPRSPRQGGTHGLVLSEQGHLEFLAVARASCRPRDIRPCFSVSLSAVSGHPFQALLTETGPALQAAQFQTSLVAWRHSRSSWAPKVTATHLQEALQSCKPEGNGIYSLPRASTGFAPLHVGGSFAEKPSLLPADNATGHSQVSTPGGCGLGVAAVGPGGCVEASQREGSF